MNFQFIPFALSNILARPNDVGGVAALIEVDLPPLMNELYGVVRLCSTLPVYGSL